MRTLNWLWRGLLFFVLFAFALNNQHTVDLKWFLGYQWQAPMVFIVLAAFALGCATGVLGKITYNAHKENEYVTASNLKSDPRVKNVLLLGVDARPKDKASASRSDTMMLISVDSVHHTIKMTSFLRDIWVYIPCKDMSQRLNAACQYGGYSGVVDTIEYNFGVKIDNYVVADFEMFQVLVDAIGGVEVKVTKAEAKEVTGHPKRYGNVYIEKSYEGTEGKQKLNGKQALAYCRIRKIDTDNARADRQKTVLLQVFKKMKGSSTTELLKVVNDLVGYVYTGYSKKELLSLATYALSNGWMNYETQTFSVPTPDHARGGNYLIGPTQLTPCGPSRGVWLWKSDIPQDAYDLQMKIYGKSNIKLAENRCDYCNLL